MRYLVELFGVSMLLTWAIELPVGCVLGLRGKRYVFLLLLVNMLTNPAAVLLCSLGASQLLVEIGVVLVEAGVYTWFSRDEKWEIAHPGWLAVTANFISWTVGLLLQM